MPEESTDELLELWELLEEEDKDNEHQTSSCKGSEA